MIQVATYVLDKVDEDMENDFVSRRRGTSATNLLC